ncbi:MAG: dienelactone hydrolase family protein [Verrucomicrobia subdivision 3 bacterium]|nr:dienelactone hydrolase family protein [Limisphaerales bacterium]
MKEQKAVPLGIPLGRVRLNGDLTMPANAQGLVLFAHGSGSSRLSPRNQYVARVLQEAGVATLLFDLLTPDEEQEDYFTAHLRFDIDLLATRLAGATRWISEESATRDFAIGYFGASTGAAAALIAAAEIGDNIGAVVSRGGRPDLAGDALAKVHAPTLLIVGGEDHVVIDLNERAYRQLRCEKQLKIIPGATHLFEERGALEQVSRLAADWFLGHLHSLEHKPL